MSEIDKPTPRVSAHQRLIEAATRVFARCGLDGATTREIAREAEVNEVTLFRQFQTKERLLAAVLQRTFDLQRGEPGDEPVVVASAPQSVPELREALGRHLRGYEELLRKNMPLMRTLIGEIHRYTEHEVRVLKGIFAPMKVEMLSTLHAAREHGVVRADVDPLIVADLLWSMVFMGVLRRTSSPCVLPEYSEDRYAEEMMDLFLRGVVAGGGEASEHSLQKCAPSWEERTHPRQKAENAVPPGTARSFDFAQDDRTSAPALSDAAKTDKAAKERPASLSKKLFGKEAAASKQTVNRTA